MITDEELLSLPDDDPLAFAAYEKIARMRYDKAWENGGDDPSNAYLDKIKRDYLNHVQTAAVVFGVKEVPDDTPPTSFLDLFQFFQIFTTAVDRFTIKTKLLHSRAVRRYSVELNTKAKNTIKHYLEQIKFELELLDLPQRKKEILFDKIIAFEVELQRTRTRFEIVGSFLVATAIVVGEATDKLEPLRKWVDSIAALIGSAKSDEEQIPQLPSPTERKRIEHKPEDELSSEQPERTGTGDQDEIPF